MLPSDCKVNGLIQKYFHSNKKDYLFKHKKIATTLFNNLFLNKIIIFWVLMTHSIPEGGEIQ